MEMFLSASYRLLSRLRRAASLCAEGTYASLYVFAIFKVENRILRRARGVAGCPRRGGRRVCRDGIAPKGVLPPSKHIKFSVYSSPAIIKSSMSGRYS